MSIIAKIRLDHTKYKFSLFSEIVHFDWLLNSLAKDSLYIGNW